MYYYGLPVVDDALVAVVLDGGLVVDVDDVVVDGGRGDPEEDQLLVKVTGRVQLGQGSYVGYWLGLDRATIYCVIV